ncbi:YggS family pyridoxal phosphate-dependent enzyme [Streptococcus sp. Z556]
MNLKKNTELVFQQIADASLEANRALDDVSVIAVTKYVDIQTAEALLPLGVRHIGENRVDKFLEKYQALKDYPVTWHLIGTLQRRKVKEVIPYVDYFHALDSLKLAQEIQKRRDQVIKCFLQVNISGEESKHGFSKEELLELLPELAKLDQIEYVGLMTMAPFEADSEKLKEIFKETQALQAEIREKQIPNMPMTELSMGMSRDFKEAIQFGSTFVRIGTAFFK